MSVAVAAPTEPFTLALRKPASTSVLTFRMPSRVGRFCATSAGSGRYTPETGAASETASSRTGRTPRARRVDTPRPRSSRLPT